MKSLKDAAARPAKKNPLPSGKKYNPMHTKWKWSRPALELAAAQGWREDLAALSDLYASVLGEPVSQNQFARTLGIWGSSYSKYLRRIYAIGPKTARRIVQAHPDLCGELGITEWTLIENSRVKSKRSI